MGVEILVRRETSLEHLARGATHMDGLDLIINPRDGSLVAVAEKNIDGVPRHVCWHCGGLFSQIDKRLRGVVVKWGYTSIQLHAQCENAPRKIFQNNLDGMQYRRAVAEVARKSNSIAAAAAEAKKAPNKIILVDR